MLKPLIMKNCCVSTCNERIGGNYKLHRLPKDPQIRDLWILASGKTDVKVGSILLICSKHFSSKQYERNLKLELTNNVAKNYRGLKINAIPYQNLPFAQECAPSLLTRGKNLL